VIARERFLPVLLALGLTATPLMAAAAPAPKPSASATPVPRVGSWTSRLAGPAGSDLQKALNERWETPAKLRWSPDAASTRLQPAAARPQERRADRKIQTCREWLASTSDWKPRGEASTINLQSQSARCRTLARLIDGHTAQADFIGPLPLDGTLMDRLPATLIPAAGDEETEELKKAAAAGVSWRGREPTLHVVEARPNEVTLESDETRAVVSLLARCDVDGDQIEDVVIERSGGGTGGTWGITEIFVLTRHSADAKGPLEIIDHIE
jgi:hypothetical protein